MEKLFRRFSEHRWCEDNLSAHIDGRLSPGGSRRIEAHLGDCARCRDALAGLRATVDALRGLPQPAARRSFRLTREQVRRPVPIGEARGGRAAAAWRTGMGLQAGALAAALLFVALLAGDLLTLREPVSVSDRSAEPVAAAVTASPTATPKALPTASPTATSYADLNAPENGLTTTPAPVSEEHSTPTGMPTATATSTPMPTASPVPVDSVLTGTPRTPAASDTTERATPEGPAETPMAAELAQDEEPAGTPGDNALRTERTTPGSDGGGEEAAQPEAGPGSEGGEPSAGVAADDGGRLGLRIAQALAAAAAAVLGLLALRRWREQRGRPGRPA